MGSGLLFIIQIINLRKLIINKYIESSDKRVNMSMFFCWVECGA